MKTPELLVGVDEFTLVLQAQEKVEPINWLNTVDDMLEVFLKLSKVEELFGEMRSATVKLIQGYTEGIAPEQPFLFIICWHEYMQNMGIAIRFSAHAWSYYQAEYEKKYQEKTDVAQFLRMVQSDIIYTTRLSRIDLVADYKNHGLHIHQIYQDLKKGDLYITNWKEHRVRLKMSAIEKDGVAETIYLGSRKENTRAFLRIYDKRSEQVANHGFRLDEALATDDWVRFEAVFKGKYAHQITDALLTEVSNANELQQFIAHKICDKYQFFDPSKDYVTDFTDELLGVAQGKSFTHLRSESPRDNSLRRSIRYLIVNAGLFPVAYKIHCLYGDDGLKRFWEYLQDWYAIYEPNRDTEIWLNKHGKTMRAQTLDDSLI